jgi:hypothetical protein
MPIFLRALVVKSHRGVSALGHSARLQEGGKAARGGEEFLQRLSLGGCFSLAPKR